LKIDNGAIPGLIHAPPNNTPNFSIEYSHDAL